MQALETPGSTLDGARPDIEAAAYAYGDGCDQAATPLLCRVIMLGGAESMKNKLGVALGNVSDDLSFLFLREVTVVRSDDFKTGMKPGQYFQQSGKHLLAAAQ